MVFSNCTKLTISVKSGNTNYHVMCKLSQIKRRKDVYKGVNEKFSLFSIPGVKRKQPDTFEIGQKVLISMTTGTTICHARIIFIPKSAQQTKNSVTFEKNVRSINRICFKMRQVTTLTFESAPSNIAFALLNYSRDPHERTLDLY